MNDMKVLKLLFAASFLAMGLILLVDAMNEFYRYNHLSSSLHIEDVDTFDVKPVGYYNFGVGIGNGLKSINEVRIQDNSYFVIGDFPKENFWLIKSNRFMWGNRIGVNKERVDGYVAVKSPCIYAFKNIGYDLFASVVLLIIAYVVVFGTSSK